LVTADRSRMVTFTHHTQYTVFVDLGSRQL